MTVIKADFFGRNYDTAHPAFVIVPKPLAADGHPKFLVDRYTRRLLDRMAFEAMATAANYTITAHEVGADDDWLESVYGFAGSPQPPQGAAITTQVSGTGTATATITFGGGPATGAGTVTLTANSTNDIDGIPVVQTAQGDTAAQVAAKVVTSLEGKQDTGATVTLHAVAAGAVVTVTETGGGDIDALTATVA